MAQLRHIKQHCLERQTTKNGRGSSVHSPDEWLICRTGPFGFRARDAFVILYCWFVDSFFVEMQLGGSLPVDLDHFLLHTKTYGLRHSLGAISPIRG